MNHPWQDLLLHLYDDGRTWVTRLPVGEWRKVAGRGGPYPDLNINLIADRGEAMNLLNATTNPSDAPPRKGFVVRPGKFGETTLTVLVPFIMSNQAVPRLSLQLGVLDRNGASATFLGYRFESPETGNEHNYFHAQPVRAFGHGERIKHSVAWYPERYPAFPLAANDAIELIASLLAAVREWQQMVLLSSSTQVSLPVRVAVGQFMTRIKVPSGV